MNLNALKNFAPAVRRQLIEAVGRKLDFVLTGDTPDLREKAKQRMSIKGKAEKDRLGLVERVAYTWFNRLAALRFLDARGWHPFLCRVITPANEEKTQPEILKLTRNGALPAELGPFTDPVRINDLLDGRIPSADPQGEVYRHLVLAACRYYHNLMPFLFEALDAETELLLPDDLLTMHSVAQGFRSAITDDDCAEAEIIGWLYQFYISDKKDEVFEGLKKNRKITPENIPAATQLFTPHWIVKYLVENSLGRLWMLNRPHSRLAGKMDYYIKPETPETDFLKISKPQEIKLCDPASGSGHMLVYAFDILYFIYEEEGYEATEIPHLILENNLYGIEIDERAGELAAFALTMKARQYDKRFFSRQAANGKPVEPNICVLQNISFEAGELMAYMDKVGRDLFTMNLQPLLHQFEEADNFGSLIRPAVTAVPEVLRILEEKMVADDLFLRSTHERVLMALKQADYLNQKYHVVIANPPYLGGKGMNGRLGTWAKDNYPDSKSDLFAMFVERGLEMLPKLGYSAMVTMQAWLFIDTYEELRLKILRNNSILNLIQIGFNSFPELNSKFALAAAFTIVKGLNGQEGHFLSLNNASKTANKNEIFFNEKNSNNIYTVNSNDFQYIEGNPISFEAPDALRKIFHSSQKLRDIAEPRQGMATGENDRFVRIWTEISLSKMGLNYKSRNDARTSGLKWFPYSKGGGFRKWYGNQIFVVNWENDGQELFAFRPKAVIRNPDYYFRECITWSLIGLTFGPRYNEAGFLFDVGGSSAFPSKNNMNYIIAFMASKISTVCLVSLNPTLNFQVGDVQRLPIVFPSSKELKVEIDTIAEQNIYIAKEDWDRKETSWNFNTNALLCHKIGNSVQKSYYNFCTHWKDKFVKLHQNEETLNQRFIDVYKLTAELSPNVYLKDISLLDDVAEVQNNELVFKAKVIIEEFISYAVGCMFGRYSLDKRGLILANAEDTLEHYHAKVGKPLDQLTFAPDDDGILPVLDGEWFEDDIVARTRDFLRTTFGEGTLEENLRFIEESLGKDLRKYFLTDFYKDHLQTYKKRPIYWLFQSPKKGFSALIYLHRYTRDTVNVLLNSYLREYLHKLRARIEHLEHAQATSENAREKTAARKESDALKKTLRECEDYERNILLPLAQQRIDLDLDDGVRVNYLKFGNALATIPGLAAKEEDG